MNPNFSVVIPAYNIRPSLEMVLRCLEAQTYARDCFECIVVDDNSTDGTREYLQRRQSSIQLVSLLNPSNLGRGATRNIGWQRAAGEIVAFLDGDTLPDPEWLSDLALAFASQNCEVVSGSRYCIEVNPAQDDLFQQLASLIGVSAEDVFLKNVASQFKALHAHAGIGAYAVDSFAQAELQLRHVCQIYPESLVSAYTFCGTNVAVRREVLQKTGGFNCFMRRGEDTDLGIRIWELGGRFFCADNAVTYHQSASTDVNRSLTQVESVAFFHRHPYQEVLLVYLYFTWSLFPKIIVPKPDLLEMLQGYRNSGEISGNWRSMLDALLPTECRYSKEDLIRYFVETTAVPRDLVSLYIDKAVQSGLYVVRNGSGVKFDIPITSRWLREQTRLHEHILVNTSHVRNQDFLFQKSCLQPPLSLSCQGIYEITVSSEFLDGFALDSILNVPLPCEGVAQRVLWFKNCWPPDLLDYTDRNMGMIARYPWPRDCPEAVISYEFACDIHELTAHGIDENEQYLRACLRLNLTAKRQVRAKSILARLGGSKTDGHSLARKIYFWILENTSPGTRSTIPSFHNGVSQEYDIAETGLGTCIDQSRLFVSLCQLAGIPARERCGALLARRIGGSGGEDVIEARSFYHSPFNHTWAEFYIQGCGWIPVEFIGWSFGARAMTAMNVADSHCREKVAANTACYDNYYFGTIDPYRIHCSDQSNRMPLSITCAATAPLETRQKLSEGIRHRLTCTVKPCI